MPHMSATSSSVFAILMPTKDAVAAYWVAVTVTDLRRNVEVLKYYQYKAAYDDTEHLEM